jgi:hypothetical protein
MHQQQLYSGHKHTHGLKYQGVITPDGFIASLFGPMAGHRHDAHLLTESGLMHQLRQLMPEQGDENYNGAQIYSLFGDAAYPGSRHLFGGYRNPPPGSLQAEWNGHMSSLRITIEWGFKNVTTYWTHLDLKRAQKVFLSPVGTHYVNGCFLTNLFNCCRIDDNGNQIAQYFHCEPLDLESYLALVDQH